MVSGQRWAFGVEAETAVTDGQALERKLALKLRDGGPAASFSLVADTRANRTALVRMRQELRGLLPLDARPVLAALRDGRQPPGSGIVVL